MSESKLLAVIPRSQTEQLQIAVKEYKGKRYLDLRIFYTTDEGANWNPTKKRVTISKEGLEILKESIDAASVELEE